MKKFEIGTYEYVTFSTERVYTIEITKIENGYATATVDGGKEKVFKIETKKGGTNDGNEYIVFRPRYHDCITPDDMVKPAATEEPTEETTEEEVPFTNDFEEPQTGDHVIIGGEVFKVVAVEAQGFFVLGREDLILFSDEWEPCFMTDTIPTLSNEITEFYYQPEPELVTVAAVNDYFIKLCHRWNMTPQKFDSEWFYHTDREEDRFAYADIRMDYNWEACKKYSSPENDLFVTAFSVRVETGICFMSTLAPHDMMRAADTIKAAAKIAEEFNDRMKDTIVIDSRF